MKGKSCRIVLTGAAGQLGQELLPRLSALGEVMCIDREAGPAGTQNWVSMDLADGGQLEVMLNRTQPDLIVNAAAYTAVDQAERDSVRAFQINSRVPARIARWSARNRKALLHYSTDYVFNGKASEPYTEADRPSPQSAYGESKLAGEVAIQASGCRHVILRSSWIYSMHGKNFVLTMLELARQRRELRVVGDQVGCPTWARNLAEYSMAAIRAGLLGRKRLPSSLYHCCDAEATSWHDFARLVFETALALELLDELPNLEAVTTDDYPQVARRPRYSVLDTRAMRRDLRQKPAALAASLKSCMAEFKRT